jgi:hypothetical protein
MSIIGSRVIGHYLGRCGNESSTAGDAKLGLRPRSRNGNSPRATFDRKRMAAAKRRQNFSTFLAVYGTGRKGTASQLAVRGIRHVLSAGADIDPTARVDVKTIGAMIFKGISAAQDALDTAPPPSFNERDHLKYLIEGQRHGHVTIRRLLQGEQNASAVDALAIARLQLEVLYSLCSQLQ